MTVRNIFSEGWYDGGRKIEVKLMSKVVVSGDWVRVALSDLGWSQAKLGRLLGVRAGTVTDWVQGGAPRYVAAYLELALSWKSTGDFFNG